MITTNVSWKAFNAHKLTREQTYEMIDWACRQFRIVCGWNIRFIGKRKGRTIHVTGHKNVRSGGRDVGGTGKGSRVRISTTSNLSRYEGKTLGMLVMHEMLHCERHGCPDWQHAPTDESYRDHLMHPGLSRLIWFAPSEIIDLQERYGRPARPITYGHIQPIKVCREEIQLSISKRDTAKTEIHRVFWAARADEWIERREVVRDEWLQFIEQIR